MYRLTGSELWLGIDAFASSFTTVALLPLGGVLADRFDRRWLLIWINVMCAVLALALCAITGFGTLHVWQIVLVSALSGIVQAAIVPASTSLLPLLVGDADIANAVALNSVQFNLARVLGPALGGLTLLHLGATWSFAFNSISFVVLAAVFILVRKVPSIDRGTSPLGRTLLDRLRFVRGRRDLLMLVAALGLLGAPLMSLLPALVMNVLGRNADAYSTLLSCFGIGAMAAALLTAVLGGQPSSHSCSAACWRASPSQTTIRSMSLPTPASPLSVLASEGRQFPARGLADRVLGRTGARFYACQQRSCDKLVVVARDGRGSEVKWRSVCKPRLCGEEVMAMRQRKRTLPKLEI